MKVEEVRRDRIRLAASAYEYETGARPFMSDEEFDKLSYKVYAERNVETGHPVLDKFFKEEVEPSTGMWVHKHPELNKLKLLCKRWDALDKEN